MSLVGVRHCQRPLLNKLFTTNNTRCCEKQYWLDAVHLFFQGSSGFVICRTGVVRSFNICITFIRKVIFLSCLTVLTVEMKDLKRISPRHPEG